MPVLTDDTSDVVSLRVSHPSEAPSLVGKSFITPWFTLDESRAEDFHRSTYLDEYPNPYGGRAGYDDDLIEGFHLLGLLDYLCNFGASSGGPWIAWNYGLDRVRFTSPVRLSDNFRIRGTVTNVVNRGELGHLVISDLVGEVRGRDRPGFVATMRVLWGTTSD